MSELVKNLLMWAFIAATMFTVFSNFSSEPQVEVISYSQFLSDVESDQVLSVHFENDNYTIKGKTVNGQNFETIKPPFLQDNLSEVLRDHRVKQLKSFLDHILLLFPFEKKFFDKEGIQSTFT